MSYLSLQNVGKKYKTGTVEVDALRGVSFDLENGEFAVVLGSSGAGKTTLLNLLGGMDAATEGEILLDGKNVTALEKRAYANTAAATWASCFSFITLCPI